MPLVTIVPSQAILEENIKQLLSEKSETSQREVTRMLIIVVHN